MDLGTLLTGSTGGLIDLAVFIGRVAIGGCFVVHALGKLGLVGTGNLAGFTDWLRSLGVPYPWVQARIANCCVTRMAPSLLSKRPASQQ